MVVSMTGFGREKAESEQHTVTVEIKSVNHRFSEFYIRMPRQLVKLEDKIKKQVAKYVKRGKVDIFITINGEGLVHRNVQVDWPLLEEYYQLVHKVKSTFSIEGEIGLSDLLQREEFISVEEIEEENENLERLVLIAVENAVKELKKMREKEGEQLKKDFLLHLKSFQQKLNDLRKYAPIVVDSYREKLEKKIKEYSESSFDESRILTEVAIFADKSDITEELTRLESHLKQFHAAIEEKEPIGRKLDFLIQEMNREINTIGSKSNDSSISNIVVELKTTVEKLREQVQNVE